MAVTATEKKIIAPAKLTAAQARLKLKESQAEIDKLNAEINELRNNYATCYICGKLKPKYKFYTSTDPLNKLGVTSICKDCAKELAVLSDKTGEKYCTEESMKFALSYLNKPFLKEVWDSSVTESENLHSGKTRETPFDSYVKNIAMPQYYTLTYRDSDEDDENIEIKEEYNSSNDILNKMSPETLQDFHKNKKDVIRLLGYDPFEFEEVTDQPFLYAQLIGLIDAGGDGNDDMMRNASCISIVRGFLQQSKLDNAISKAMVDIDNIEKNSATITSLQDSKSKVSSVITSLAAESCISLKNNKNAKKGENTWTGKIKKIKDLNLREGEVNGFDIWTCKGMQQVMEMSDASIMKQLHLDESEWSDIVAEQRVMVRKYQEDCRHYKEISRILLRENIDLKDVLKENNLLDKESLTDLDDLYSYFAADELGEQEVDDNDDQSKSRENDQSDNLSN